MCIIREDFIQAFEIFKKLALQQKKARIIQFEIGRQTIIFSNIIGVLIFSFM